MPLLRVLFVRSLSRPLRMKVPKSKQRALNREFGLDMTAPSEEEAEKRRADLRALVKLGKTRRHLIQQGARAEQIQQHAMGEGMRTLRQDGIEKVLAGVTTIEEVRATSNS